MIRAILSTRLRVFDQGNKPHKTAAYARYFAEKTHVILAGVIDQAPLQALVVFRIVEDAQAQSGALADGAVYQPQGQRCLLVFAPDAEGQPLDRRAPVIDGDVRRQTEIERPDVGCCQRQQYRVVFRPDAKSQAFGHRAGFENANDWRQSEAGGCGFRHGSG